MRTTKNLRKYPRKMSAVPVTQAMLFGVRDELKAEIRSHAHAVKAEFSSIRSEFSTVKSEISKLTSQVHRLGVLIEEQNARNAIVLDGLMGLSHRQDHLEGETRYIKRIISGLK